jgi:thiol:disulfide interchange protein
MKIVITKFWGWMLVLLLINSYAPAQTPQKVNWISFSQLSDSLQLKPKKVFIGFYADWCTYCKEMERTTFTDAKVIDLLNHEYYAVKMNIESSQTMKTAHSKFHRCFQDDSFYSFCFITFNSTLNLFGRYLVF